VKSKEERRSNKRKKGRRKVGKERAEKKYGMKVEAEELTLVRYYKTWGRK